MQEICAVLAVAVDCRRQSSIVAHLLRLERHRTVRDRLGNQAITRRDDRRPSALPRREAQVRKQELPQRRRAEIADHLHPAAPQCATVLLDGNLDHHLPLLHGDQRELTPGRRLLYYPSKGMTRISTKNQITLPVSALTEAGLRAGEAVIVEPAGDGELRVRRAAMTFESALGALTGAYPAGYLDMLDAEDAQR
jgi:bifunctional DNA-binding transcriptional regulator/antitoxin component of YhaV-PrlF toxin-antitoxin module